MVRRILIILGIGTGAILLANAMYFLVGTVPQAKQMIWGVNFSAKQAMILGLDWKAVYAALLDDLETRHLKISLDWNDLEPERNAFSFQNADWQVAQAEERDAKLTLVVGMKTLRWPECHVPIWAQELPKNRQQEEVLELLRAVVERYKDSPALARWQVENEPLFPFGECPWKDRKFLEKEVELVRSIDPNHPVIISDSGEFSFWIQAGRMGDVVSGTLYRRVWFEEIGRYIEYPLPPTFYGRKAKLASALFDVEIIDGELQAEPWAPGKLLPDATIKEQDAAFDMEQFRKNINFAKRTGIAEHYLWGAEWWYWRREVAEDSSFWDEARKLY